MPQPGHVTLLTPDSMGPWHYLAEILRHAGVPFEQVAAGRAAEVLREPRRLLVLVGTQALDEPAADAVVSAVQAGAALVAVGGTGGLDSLLGLAPAESEIRLPYEPIGPMEVYGSKGFGYTPYRHMGEGYLKRHRAHPITGPIDRPLHVFACAGVTAREADVQVQAELLDAHQRPLKLVGASCRRVGDGLTVFLAPDIARSVALIQQGRFVDQDGPPAPDGSAPLNDGILKAEDGLVLDWTFDRQHSPLLESAAFLVPVADRLREVLVRAVLWSAGQVGCMVPVLWYHPQGRDATALLSMDSDGNVPAQAHGAMDLLRSLQVQGTICAMVPAYPREVFDAWGRSGHEIALHYDAFTANDPNCAWGRETLVRQWEGLKAAAGLERIVSNKNHYTRWEGRLAFFEWLAELGIEADQSRGPSKRGTCGYPFGSCHPWRPMRDDGTLIDVFEIPLSTQDVPITGPAASLRLWLEGAMAHGGVLHILFHPAHLDKRPMSDALSDFVVEARRRGLVWQRCDQIVAWQRARYGFCARADGEGWQTLAETPLAEACLLVFGPERVREITIGGTRHAARRVKRFGLPAAQVVADLHGEAGVVAGGR